MYNYEQDLIMRIIQEIVRTMMKMLFNIDSIESASSHFESEAMQSQYTKLLRLVDQGKINEAENELYEMLETDEKENFKLSLLFYNYLNNLADENLREGEFSRAEIELGIRTVAKKYGYEGFVNTYLFENGE